MLLLSWFIPLIGPLVSFIVGLQRSRQQGAGWLIGFGAVFGVIQLMTALMVAIALPNFFLVEQKAKEAEVKQNCHAIQLAVERYAVDNEGVYPADMEILRTAGYLPKFPNNPFTKQEMRDIKPGEKPVAGEFTYKPVEKNGSIAGYIIRGYGSEKLSNEASPGPGMEHVIIELSSQP